jgi:hypothetical protein
MHKYLILLSTIILCCCSPQLEAIPDPTQVNLTTAETPKITQSLDPQLDQITSLAVADLAEQLSLDPGHVRIQSVESMLWPDSSLGCPEPGKVYDQGTVRGYLLRLEANGQAYIYHTDTDQTVILCSEEDLLSFPVTPGEIDDGKPWMPVN